MTFLDELAKLAEGKTPEEAKKSILKIKWNQSIIKLSGRIQALF